MLRCEMCESADAGGGCEEILRPVDGSSAGRQGPGGSGRRKADEALGGSRVL